ncbi:hypothetical protein RM543_07830 [Roseicyclus sp. F158]|uniref:DUF4864 domain-containing protein n=1 Tax=Tropicimonas omnivorans TaxID=3075590 RepID=A0ABU3DFX3_9RHOB|nr:hypothetical protein [Roseicyclus sp. F158]MDT0682590.1 hypothetical protein [Roseicyclus sp. F158]
MITHKLAPPLLAAVLLVSGGLAAPLPAQVLTAPGGVTIEQSYATALVRDTLAAISQANRTGNYTVLRDIAAPSFAASNDPAALGAFFSNLRSAGPDLLPALALDPEILRFETTPDSRQLRLVGYIPAYPEHISFDLTFEQVQAAWRVNGMSVGGFAPIDRTEQPRPAPGGAPTPSPAPVPGQEATPPNVSGGDEVPAPRAE